MCPTYSQQISSLRYVAENRDARQAMSGFGRFAQLYFVWKRRILGLRAAQANVAAFEEVHLGVAPVGEAGEDALAIHLL